MENRKVGALWLKEGKSGKEFMSGELIINGQKHPIVAFKRDKKKNEKEPDWDLLKSLPQEGIKIEPIKTEEIKTEEI